MVAVEVVSVGSQAEVERKAEVEVVVRRVWCLGLWKRSRQATAEAEAEAEAGAEGEGGREGDAGGGGGGGGGGGERRRGGHGRRRAEFRKRQVVPTGHFVAETAPEESIYNAHSKNTHQRQTKEPTGTRTEHET